MIMKQLFRHTTSLLRTALLFGAAALFNILPTQAQTMPDAFQTVDPANVIGDGNYYYIQFYEDLKATCFDRAYLSDTGVGNDVWSKDYIPFAKNIQWKLVGTGTQFKLQSGEGNFIKLDGSQYKIVATEGEATTLTFYRRDDGGYEISPATDQNNAMRRDKGQIWQKIDNYNHKNIRNCLRVAKLKENIAYIIYYQNYNNFDWHSETRGGAAGYTDHHYLTYSGTNSSVTALSLISQDSDDNSLWTKEAPSTAPSPSVITPGVGKDGGCIVIHSADYAAQDWDTQFFIRANKVLGAGTTVHLEFDYKADVDATVSTQGHGEPGDYVNNNGVGSINFTTSWQHLSEDINITDEGDGDVQTIAFNLSVYRSANTYYFDNIVFTIAEADTEKRFLSSRSSIFRQHSEWYPVAAAYHQDGLWTLEQVGNDGSFFIKKYQGTDYEYVTLDYQGVGTYYGLGSQSNKSIFTLDDPNARRFTAIKNTATNKYVNFTNGDGAYVFDMAKTAVSGNTWYAGFLPVEVPVPNKNDFYQVVLRFGENANSMVNERGGWAAYNSESPVLWQIEQVNDYTHFHFRNPKTGTYLVADGVTSDFYEGARVYPYDDVVHDFVLEWRYVNPVSPETRVNHKVTHKTSYLKNYATAITNQEGLKHQGLTTAVNSDWENMQYPADDPRAGTQKVNLFEITHYVERGKTVQIGLPTVLNQNNDHVFFQRWYNYAERDDAMNLDNLKSHVSLSTSADGTVQYYLYDNGIVVGDKLHWATRNEGMKQYALRYFNYTNSDGQPFTVAADVSRYSDMTYEKPDPLSGDLEEPSLTMRYLFYMNDAKDMATQLTACTSGSGKWYEKTKTIHFGRTQVPYTKYKKVGYRGEFLGIRHLFSDYWVYDDPLFVKIEGGNAVIDKVYINNTYLHKANLSDITDEELNAFLDNHLVSAVNDNNGGKIFVEVYDPHGTGIRKGGYNPNINLRGYDEEGNDDDYEGYYFYDKIARNQKTEYGNSRFVVFRYPDGGIVTKCGQENAAYLRVYLKVDETTKYQIAQFEIVFDENMATRPWTKLNNGLHYANQTLSDMVKGTSRDPNELRRIAGKPIAKITFDFPKKMKISGSEVDATYQYPIISERTDVATRHDGREHNPATDEPNEYNPYVQGILNSSPVPMTFDHTNYAFDGDGANWGSYAIVTGKSTIWGNAKNVAPADDETYGYNIDADPGMQKGFLYIDASEQPGDICAVDFEGEFCSEDRLICSGWISGSNRYDDDGEYRCAGSITLTVKGEDKDGNKKDIYRFCPGQIYELDNGYGNVGAGEADIVSELGAGVDGRGNGATNVVWQQFYFEFSTDQKYERYWLEVNNNCVSSNGGDFMLDNIEVYTTVPEVEPDINTPVCVSLDNQGKPVTEMRLLKLKIKYNKLLSSRTLIKASDFENPTEEDLKKVGTAEEGFVFLDKYKFLETFKTGLQALTAEEKLHLGLEDYNFNTITVDELAEAIDEGKLSSINMASLHEDHNAYKAYKNAFDEAILGNKTTWHSDNPTDNLHSSIMYFRWNGDKTKMTTYSFDDAVNKKHSVYYEVVDGEEYVVMNGNYPGLDWKTNTDYYVINTNEKFSSGKPFTVFNLCSQCCKSSTFRIKSPYTVLGLEQSEGTDDYVVCEGQIPTIALNLKGYDLEGNPVDMKGLNYDWWLGDNTAEEPEDRLATLDNYHKQHKEITYEDANGSHTVDVRLDVALSTFRSYYPSITSLDGVTIRPNVESPVLTQPMIIYLKDLVAKGQLVLHQSTIGVPAEKNSDEDPYFYVVACPIHDEAFDQALKTKTGKYVSYFCDQPQGLRIKVGDKAPRLKSGFVPGENGISAYNYNFPEGTDPVLSIRLAKKAQFEEVQHGNVSDNPADTYNTTASTDKHFLWLPIRNAVVESTEATGVVRKSRATVEGSDDYNVYLSSTDDPTWDKMISVAMSGNKPSLPIVGKIVKLNAVDTKGSTEQNPVNQTSNRLCIYFIKYLTDAEDESKVFEVREGYNYTLSLPFKENAGNNSCDGNILINMKIVPDYEVWTGAAGNTDWNNDQNWRRADGNTASGGLDDLYVGAAKTGSPLKDYKTNDWNYRTPKDRIFRKGFAPLYCTHVLMSRDEWGNAPELYDALDGKSSLTASPFPNLRDEDGWDGSTGVNKKKATATSILKFDMQARKYDIWSETYGSAANKGRLGDMLAEMYQVNSCDEIAFQPGTELLNAHLLNYNSAWVEFELETKRWYLLGSPLQGTISGEWYAPTGTAKQKTTYYDNVTFGSGYDRYSPAIYQRSWDKAKAVLYEVGSEYSTNDDSQTQNPGSGSEGLWEDENEDPQQDPDWQWNVDGGGTADEYLDRLGYKPMSGKKANVAIQGIWSNTYNDAQVDYGTGGFSVMVMNHLKSNDTSGGTSVIRLPKEDSFYDYYGFDRKGGDNVSQNEDIGTNTQLSDVRGKGRALNRGRLKTDQLLPDNVTVSVNSTDITTAIKKQEATASVYGDQRTYTRIPIKEDALTAMNSTFVAQNDDPATAGFFTEAVAVGASNLGYYLVENPFPCGLDMKAFFGENSGLQKKYWLLTTAEAGQSPRQQLVQQAPNGEWVTASEGTFAAANGIVAPGQGFFVEIDREQPTPPTTITYTKAMLKQSRYGVKSDNGTTYTIEVGRNQVMKPLTEMVDDDDNPETPSVEKPVTMFVDEDGDGIPEEEVPVMVPETDDQGNPVTTPIEQDVVVYNYVQASGDGKRFPLKTRGEGAEAILPGLVITAERDKSQSSALVMQRDGASNDFLPEEDTEVFINSDLVNAPTVYTLCGRLATTINTVRDFRSLPLGVESTSDAPCTLTFRGVEMLGDSISFYDAVEQKLTPLESGMTFKVSGQTQNRYYLVRSLNKKDAAEETHIQIFTEGLKAKVIASTAEPITVVRCFDTGGRLIYTASPQLPEYSFDLPRAGVYIIEAETEHDRKTRKVIVK